MSSIRTHIRDSGIKILLKRIITGANSGGGYVYVNTIREQNIGIPVTSVERMKEFPFINVYFDNEVCANSSPPSALQTGGNRQLWHNATTLILDCWIVGAEDPQLAQENILADILAVFGNDYTINSTVFSCAYESSQPFGTELNRPDCGITIRFDVWYRIFQTNPGLSG